MADGDDMLHLLRTTRAIRRFTDEPLTDDELWAVLDAAQHGPSGGNIQPWQFLVLTDGDAKAAVAAVYRRAYDRYETALLAGLPPFRTPEAEASFHRSVRASRHLAEHLQEAPAIVCVLVPDGLDLTMHDDEGPLDIGHPCASVYPAVQNLLVAARALGIGGTLTTVARVEHDDLRSAAGIPDRYGLAALVPLGRPRGEFSQPVRRPVDAVTHWNAWGEKRARP
ncbi:MAG: nitroreductase family protein [Actinomycetota bacterium]|nr:nitroreductase family protein [Acidimicrobiia bacterium]MDQ3294277.1 nitroreductase family protein [Actinomycetota bacterium]